MTTTAAYMDGRKKWSRPQAMVWCDDRTVDVNGKLIPAGYELGSNTTNISAQNLEQTFIILSDHNRSEINITNERIEQRQRMANGTMRSFFIADKLTIDTSWSMLPSRSFDLIPNFNQTTGKPVFTTSIDHDTNPATPPKPVTEIGSRYFPDQQYTADGGAGGVDMLSWYESHKGPFWVLLSYDNYANFGSSNDARNKLGQYTEARQMYISNFNYSIVKRGGNNFDMWNISVSLEEV
jgi:hypothetical protein